LTAWDEPAEWRARDVLLWLIVVAAVLGAISITLATRPTASPTPEPAAQASPAPSPTGAAPGG